MNEGHIAKSRPRRVTAKQLTNYPTVNASANLTLDVLEGCAVSAFLQATVENWLARTVTHAGSAMDKIVA